MTDFRDRQNQAGSEDHFDWLDTGDVDQPEQTNCKARRNMEELSMADLLFNIPEEGYRILMLMVDMLQDLDEPDRKTASACLEQLYQGGASWEFVW